MKISLIVPVLNEEEAIPFFYSKVTEYEGVQGYDLEIIFINDGSKDGTERILEDLCTQDDRVTLVSLSRCFGKEAAMMAGFAQSSGDAVIPIDVDLQDPIELIPEMVDAWKKGWSVVLAKRSERPEDSWLKRLSASMFYSVYNKVSPLKIEMNVGDYRLLDRQVVQALLQLPERQLFMKGLFAWLGFPTYVVEYTRQRRVAGQSKFNGWKLWNFALDGITSFSTLPLRVWTYAGFSVALFSFIYAVWMVIDKLLNGNPVPGYPSIITSILFLGGIQLIGIGVLGEYVGRIYMESKHRPQYIIKNVVRNGNSLRSGVTVAVTERMGEND